MSSRFKFTSVLLLLLTIGLVTWLNPTYSRLMDAGSRYRTASGYKVVFERGESPASMPAELHGQAQAARVAGLRAAYAVSLIKAYLATGLLLTAGVILFHCLVGLEQPGRLREVLTHLHLLVLSFYAGQLVWLYLLPLLDGSERLASLLGGRGLGWWLILGVITLVAVGHFVRSQRSQSTLKQPL